MATQQPQLPLPKLMPLPGLVFPGIVPLQQQQMYQKTQMKAGEGIDQQTQIPGQATQMPGQQQQYLQQMIQSQLILQQQLLGLCNVAAQHQMYGQGFGLQQFLARGQQPFVNPLMPPMIAPGMVNPYMQNPSTYGGSNSSLANSDPTSSQLCGGVSKDVSTYSNSIGETTTEVDHTTISQEEEYLSLIQKEDDIQQQCSDLATSSIDALKSDLSADLHFQEPNTEPFVNDVGGLMNRITSFPDLGDLNDLDTGFMDDDLATNAPTELSNERDILLTSSSADTSQEQDDNNPLQAIPYDQAMAYVQDFLRHDSSSADESPCDGSSGLKRAASSVGGLERDSKRKSLRTLSKTNA